MAAYVLPLLVICFCYIFIIDSINNHHKDILSHERSQGRVSGNDGCSGTVGSNGGRIIMAVVVVVVAVIVELVVDTVAIILIIKKFRYC